MPFGWTSPSVRGDGFAFAFFRAAGRARSFFTDAAVLPVIFFAIDFLSKLSPD
jgi:hypothetical protein